MKIIISPAKTMKPCKETTGTIPLFEKKAEQIREELIHDPELFIKYGYNEEKTNLIKEKMKDQHKYQAIHYFNGTVFKQISSTCNDSMYILDAMYGLLRPSDLISFYRLDYLMYPKYYDYYKESINEILSKEDLIIDLASKEFTRYIEHPHKITIDFILLENNKIKRPSMILKKCRGMFVNELLKGKELKEITVEGFKYDQELSTQNTYVYKKQA